MRTSLLIAVVAALQLLTPDATYGGLIVNVTENNGDVVFAASGSINLIGLTFESSGAVPAYIDPTNGTYFVGATAGPADTYLLDPPGITTPMFGSGGLAAPDFGSGDQIGVFFSLIRVPVGYTSGSSVNASMTFVGASFLSLGLTPGTYVSTLPNTDTFTLNVSAVPEPTSFALVGLGSISMLVCGTRRRLADRNRVV